ncbi:Uncharacterised protein [uncultured archaeon]|nr:Uncharacterised protein [uncultured archaeon]
MLLQLGLETVAIDSTLIDSKKVESQFGTMDISDARDPGPEFDRQLALRPDYKTSTKFRTSWIKR